MHHGMAAVVDGVLARQDIDWAGNQINGTVPVPAPETDCVVSNCMYGYVALLEVLMVLCTRIAVTGRLVTSRTLLASVLLDAVVGHFDF